VGGWRERALSDALDEGDRRVIEEVRPESQKERPNLAQPSGDNCGGGQRTSLNPAAQKAAS